MSLIEKPALRPALESAIIDFFGAERRLRYRDQQSGQLTTVQLQALAVLDKEKEVIASQLARSADLNPASVTSMLDVLEDNGIIQRRTTPQDRRVWLISMTDKGRAQYVERTARWDALWEKHIGGLSKSEVAAGARAIRAITELFDSL